MRRTLLAWLIGMMLLTGAFAASVGGGPRVAAEDVPVNCSNLVYNGDFEISTNDHWTGLIFSGSQGANTGSNGAAVWGDNLVLTQALDTSALPPSTTVTISFYARWAFVGPASIDVGLGSDSTSLVLTGTYTQYTISHTLGANETSVSLSFTLTAGTDYAFLDTITSSCSAPLTPTATATSTPTDTATALPTDTATAVPTDTATANPTDTATAIPTDTATAVPTAVSTSTQLPTIPATVVATATGIPATQPPALGAANVTLVTADGGAIPDDANVCVGDRCQSVGAAVSSAAVSPVTVSFLNLDPGTYPVTVTNAAPYGDVTSSITIVGGETSDLTVTLDLAVLPTQPGGATPVTTATNAPAQPTATTTTTTGSTGANPPPASGGTGNPAKVTALPNTGAGGGSSNAGLVFLLAAVIAVLGAGCVGWRRRHS